MKDKKIKIIGINQIIDGVQSSWSYDENGNIINYKSDDPNSKEPYDNIKFDETKGLNDAFGDFQKVNHTGLETYIPSFEFPIGHVSDVIDTDSIHLGTEPSKLLLKNKKA